MQRASASSAIRSGDTVKVLAGIDRGKTGKVTQVLLAEARVVVEGVNFRKKNIRAVKGRQKGEIIQYNAPLALANVELMCPHCNKPTRIGHQRNPDGTKVRMCKRCKLPIENKQ